MYMKEEQIKSHMTFTAAYYEVQVIQQLELQIVAWTKAWQYLVIEYNTLLKLSISEKWYKY